MILIVDYGMGNLRSVQKAFERIKVPVNISSHSKDIVTSEKIILPGVGHFAQGMYNLKQRGLLDTLNEAVLEKKIPILGICLGMQLFTDFSEEGNTEGLGWIKAKTKRFLFQGNGFKIPHMGWNYLSIKNDASLYRGIDKNHFYYFVHSYHVICDDENDILAETFYGSCFVSSFHRENIYGCQFHPEKSHDAGLQVLTNFAHL